MTRLRLLLPIALTMLAVFTLSYGLSYALGAATGDESASREPPTAPISSAPPREHPIDWIVAGGGALPALSQVQLEQDLALASAVFGATAEGTLLFAGGRDSHAVQVLSDRPPPDPLLEALGDLFDPRPGRQSRYRRTHLAPEGAATADDILGTLETALTLGTDPLTVYLAGHGAGGEAPRDSHFMTWGPHDIWVEDLAEVLDAGPGVRTTRVIITSCHAGGFADIAFAGGDPERGVAHTDRCGFFATTWDREASGCDPNPDRGAQEGYGIHFLYALQGRDRHDEILSGRFDLDGDDAISLLEAHTVARIESGSLDVPVTTSDTFLRVLDLSASEPFEAPELPEEALVIAMLGARLSMPDAFSVSTALDHLTGELEPTAEALDDVTEAVDEAEEALRAALLHRWPVLDDPYHPDFPTTLADHRAEIQAMLVDSPLAIDLGDLEARRDELGAEHDDLLLRATPLLRLERSHETVALAGRLKARGGEDWDTYQRLLTCERGGLGPMRDPAR